MSVCLAVYNGERYLEPQLRSILGQLGQQDEVVIVDDASNDGSAALIARCGDTRIRYMRNASNIGVVRTFERAIQATSGQIIFLSDQDDIWREDKVRVMLSYFDSTQAVCIQSGISLVDERGQSLPDNWLVRRARRPGLVRNWILNGFMGCTMAFRAQLKEAILPFPDIYMHDEWIGQVATLCGPVLTIRDRLVAYRRHDANVTEMRPGSLAFMIGKRLRFLRVFIPRAWQLARKRWSGRIA